MQEEATTIMTPAQGCGEGGDCRFEKKRLMLQMRSTFSKRSLTARSNLTGLTGNWRQATASEEPVRLIQTTEAADGTRTAAAPKWSLARRNPMAEDFMDVSMAMVLAVVSPNPRTRATR